MAAEMRLEQSRCVPKCWRVFAGDRHVANVRPARDPGEVGIVAYNPDLEAYLSPTGIWLAAGNFMSDSGKRPPSYAHHHQAVETLLQFWEKAVAF